TSTKSTASSKNKIMHYRNGRQAQEGDPVIGETYKGSGVIIAGKIHGLLPGQTQCNCTVAVPVYGGTEQQTCRTVSDFYHAADAFAAIEATMAGSPAAPMPPGGWPKCEPPQSSQT